MLFALWPNATPLCSGGCHLRSPNAFAIKTKPLLARRSLHAVVCIRLVYYFSVLRVLSYIPRMDYWGQIPSSMRIRFYSTMENPPQVLQQRC